MFTNGLKPKTHKGFIKLFNQLSIDDSFITTEEKSLIQTLFDSRQGSDYGDFITFEFEEIQKLMDETKILIVKYKEALR